jgi:AbrB family looped-hinge helix DNA binding protein
MVLPAEVRERLNIKDGEWVTLILEPDGVIRILTGAVYARSLRGIFKHLGKPGQSMVDDLIADRRREAAMEAKEIDAFVRRQKVKKRR